LLPLNIQGAASAVTDVNATSTYSFLLPAGHGKAAAGRALRYAGAPRPPAT